MELEVADRPGTQDLAARAAAALALDRQERRARLVEGKPLIRLPRHFPGENVRLGQERSQVPATLPTGPFLTKQEWPQGVYLIDSRASPRTPFLVRHRFIRFDSQGRVAELRNRYGPGESSGNWQQTLVGGLVKQAGAAAEKPGPWQRCWEDLPAGKLQAKLYRWQDDLTAMTCQEDSWLAEIILRDAGNAEGMAVSLPPLEYLPRGPGPVLLGATREEVAKQYAGGFSNLPDGSIMVRPPSNSPFETLIVWFAAGRVMRMVAHHNQAIPAGASPSQLAKFLRQAWGGETARLGWPCRQDFSQDRELQSLGWQDDRTRIRMGWQYSQHGPPRLFTEWKVCLDKAP
jgi:hypothetical protein